MNKTIGENLLSDQRSRAALRPVLTQIDTDLAAQARAQGCSCGGTLHRANYPRKIRGISVEAVRDSFRCAEEGCRRRTTPESVRFLGRRVYAGFRVVLLTALRHGLTAARVTVLQEQLGGSTRRPQALPVTARGEEACGLEIAAMSRQYSSMFAQGTNGKR